MLKKILVGAAFVAAALLIFVAMQSGTYRVERTQKIAASPEAVFAEVNDLHNWDHWSPWAKVDPKSKAEFEGPEKGEGAIFKWSGNADIGEGKMTIVESRPNELVRIKLEFERPFKDNSLAEFTFKPVGDQTAVTWSMTGDKTFFAKALHLCINMDSMLGGLFDKGLQSMKDHVEHGPEPGDLPLAAPVEAGSVRLPAAGSAVSDEAKAPADGEVDPRKTE